ncbi:MAG: imidazole glycerol phosphate synthase, glutamine amidotransferase subunit [Chitinophagaceae bacterium]|nr:imidazole glycerol phosphate synthase, glutamine amidotransferase subunit [Chitinophagaceae bacterium]
MNIAIIKYNAGNVQSVQYALERLGYSAVVTDDHNEIKNADKVIFPGVGNAYSAMQSLKEKKLDELIKQLTQPVLGICVGMQLLCNHSEENDTTGLGIIDLNVKKFVSEKNNFKIPQMGWNNIYNLSSPLFEDVKEDSFVYYVHSYYAEIGKETIATTDYIFPYSAVIQKNNFYGVQFHTEKSAEVGDKILLNFLNLK